MCTDTDLLKEKTEQVPAGLPPPGRQLTACVHGLRARMGAGVWKSAGVLSNSLSPCSRGIPFLAWCNQFIEVQRDLWPGAQTGPCLFLLCPPAEEWPKKKVKGSFSVCNILLEHCPRHSFNVWPIAVWGVQQRLTETRGPQSLKVWGPFRKKCANPIQGATVFVEWPLLPSPVPWGEEERQASVELCGDTVPRRNCRSFPKNRDWPHIRIHRENSEWEPERTALSLKTPE